MPKKSQTESRKKDHVDLVVGKGAQYRKSAGFERIDFMHNALPELDLEQVDLSTKFLGRRVAFPVLITGMTGGYPEARDINRALASVAQKHGLAFGVGSQRAMIEDPALASTYKVRDAAPNVPILANIGAFQLKKYSPSQIDSLVSDIDADGLAIHLNALQEVVQREGDKDFSGVLDAIATTCDRVQVPVIVKETGAGLGQDAAVALKRAGADYVDVSGAGGTSWSAVEYLRSSSIPGFEDWGIPTVDSIIQCRGVLPIIASGGVRDGIDASKAIALGADMAGAAYPFIKSLKEGSIERFAQVFTDQMRICAYLTGSRDVASLKKAKLRML